MKRFAFAALSLVLLAVPAGAQQKFRFAVVPKAMNNPFFDVARDGCLKRARELGNVECLYKGPIEHEPATQAQIIQDFITQKVDGLAISVADVAAMTRSIDAAVAAGIPVVTFDADAPGSKRAAYIGTNNKDFGLALGKQLLQLRPTAANMPWSRADRRQEPAGARRGRPRGAERLEMDGGLRLSDLLQR